MKYKEFRYIYPPRPEQTTQPSQIEKYDNGEYIAQPKYNGTCCVLFLTENSMKVMNRHNGFITSNYSEIDLRGLYQGEGYMVLVGEFLNKNKKGEKGEPFNLKFVIFDILVYNGEYLLETKFIDRMSLLDRLYPTTSTLVTKGGSMNNYKHLYVTPYENVFRAPSYTNDFIELYNDIVDTDLYEGIVLKRKNAKLKFGFSEKNNSDWQIKCRKPTKNYDF